MRNKDNDGRRRATGPGHRARHRRCCGPSRTRAAPAAAAPPRRLAPYAGGWSTASFVLGILSILTLNLLLGAIAIGLGRYAQGGSTGVDADIRRRATRGVLLGSVGSLLSLVAAAVLIVVYVANG